MDLSKLTVFVADDMSSMRMMIKAVLRQVGIEAVAEAGDGVKAIEALSARSYDLLICDWDMPKATGLEVLQHVRGDPSLAKLPFIMLTANANRVNVQQAIDAGVSDYLAKPFKPEDLLRKIRRVLR